MSVVLTIDEINRTIFASRPDIGMVAFGRGFDHGWRLFDRDGNVLPQSEKPLAFDDAVRVMVLVGLSARRTERKRKAELNE